MNIDDLCTQADLNEDTLVETLSTRYRNGQIYTHSGLMLLSINPYAELDLYNQAVSEMYKKKVENLQPHIFSLVESCLDAIPVFGPHSIVISGESGSGKTETARKILTYLGISMIESVEAILEAFGNAWTIKNDNSSRFGRLISLDKSISVKTFLLEKSRVTAPTDGRNFHIFYYITADKDKRLVNDYIDCTIHEDQVLYALHKQEYLKIKHAFLALQIDFLPIESILWGILELGSINILNNKILNYEALEAAAGCLGLNKERLEEYLLHRTINVCNESIVCDNSDEEAKTFRDSIARLLYDGLFAVITGDINKFLSKNPIGINNIHILDIFGFENMPKNGLEQFCINWCNERMYDEFVRGTFDYQKSILESEGILKDKNREELGNMENKWHLRASCIEMIEKKCGLADLIAEESFINGNAENLGIKIGKFLKEKILPGDILKIEHFSGAVKYCLEDFTSKNKEKGDLRILCGNSPKETIQRIIEEGLPSTSVVKSFQNNLHSLFLYLEKTTIKYVKCIRPNSEKAPLFIDKELVKTQLKANGVLQSVELSRSLFPYSMFIDDFDERYGDSIRESLKMVRGNTRYFFNNRTFNILEMSRKHREMLQNWTIRETCRRLINILQEEEEQILETEQQLRKERITLNLLKI
ncbi:hypothetical protein PAEPH01_1419 [Pancytospora epiphaga]|nr:hypothetical protein PAEPH01_1419 [Pancytospora epiphaga]